MIGLSWLGVGDDLQPSLLVDDEPGPSAAETADSGGLELRLELVDASEGLHDRLGELADGRPSAPPGSSSSQKKVWLECPPPLLRTAVRIGSGTAPRSAMSALTALGREVGVVLKCVVEVVHVSRVVLVVMDLHRARVDVGFERFEGVGKCGKCVGHKAVRMNPRGAVRQGGSRPVSGRRCLPADRVCDTRRPEGR